jgi:hypothetical protein
MKREFAVFIALLTLGAIACRKPATEPVEPASQSSATSSGSTAPAEAEESAGEILARIHFSGTRKLAGDTNAATLNRIGALPETAALKKMVLDKLATAPGHRRGGRVDPSAAERPGGRGEFSGSAGQ